MYTINQNFRRREVYILLLSKVVLARSVMRWHSLSKILRGKETIIQNIILKYLFLIVLLFFLQYSNNYFYYLTFYNMVIMFFDFFND